MRVLSRIFGGLLVVTALFVAGISSSFADYDQVGCEAKGWTWVEGECCVWYNPDNKICIHSDEVDGILKKLGCDVGAGYIDAEGETHCCPEKTKPNSTTYQCECEEGKAFNPSKGTCEDGCTDFYIDLDGGEKKCCPVEANVIPENGECECDDGKVFNPGTAMCETGCDEGYYFQDGECHECDAGFYCPGDNTKRACPDNWRSDPGSKFDVDCYRTVNFNKNGGSGTINGTGGTTEASKVCNYNTPCTVTNPSGGVLTLSGYSFPGGWGTSSCTAATPTSPVITSTSSLYPTVYACKAPITFYIQYHNECPGTPGGSMSTQNVTYASGAVLPDNGFDCTGGSGYTFRGFAQDSPSGYLWGPGANISELETHQNATLHMYALWEANQSSGTYTITVTHGAGVSGVNTSLSGWTCSNGTCSKDLAQDATINFSNGWGVTYKNGYHGLAYTTTAGSMSGSTYTVGSSNATITVEATALYGPSPSITGASTKTYNESNNTLTVNVGTTYDSSVTVYYEFGQTNASSSTSCGSYTWSGTAGTTNNLTVTKNAFFGYKCYKVSVHAEGEGGLGTSEVRSNAVTVGRIRRSITFNANGGTLDGSSTGYAQYGSSTLYNSATSASAATVSVPSAYQTGKQFDGWYTAATGGIQVYNASGVLQRNVSGYTNASSQWIPTGNKTLYAHYSSIYKITVTHGAGVSGVNTSLSGWTCSNGTCSKDLAQGATVDLSNFSPVFKTGYTQTNPNYVVSGAGSVSGSTYTVGSSNATITVEASGLVAPSGNLASYGPVDKTYNQSDTVPAMVVTTEYADGVTLYYEFGFSNNVWQAVGTGCYNDINWTGNYTTDNTVTIDKDAFYGYKCYRARVYAQDAYGLTSDITYSFNAYAGRIRRSITFNANGGTLDGSSTGYAEYDNATLYLYSTASNTVSVPLASKTGKQFDGWYTAATGGIQVYNASGVLQRNVSGYTNASSQWIPTENKTLYAHYSDPANSNCYRIDIDYSTNGGGNGAPTSIYLYYDNTTASKHCRLYTDSNCTDGNEVSSETSGTNTHYIIPTTPPTKPHATYQGLTGAGYSSPVSFQRISGGSGTGNFAWIECAYPSRTGTGISQIGFNVNQTPSLTLTAKYECDEGWRGSCTVGSDYSISTECTQSPTSTVYFDANGGSGGRAAGATGAVTATYGSSLPNIANDNWTTPFKYGYKFGGYCDTTNSSGGSCYYDVVGTPSMVWDKTISPVTLFARWSAYEGGWIKFYDTLGTQDVYGADCLTAQCVLPTYQTAGLSAPSGAVSGNPFAGWAFLCDNNGSVEYCNISSGGATDSGLYAAGTNYASNNDFFGRWSVDAIDSTYRDGLHACWNIGINYNLSGGAANPSGTPTSFNNCLGATLPTPTYANHVFNGWYTNSSFSGNPVTTIEAGTTGTQTFYPKWTATACNTGEYLNNGTCNTCPTGYTSNGATATSQADCFIQCPAGKRISTPGGTCDDSGNGPWVTTTGQTVYYGNISPVTYCMYGYNTMGSTYHSSINSCNRSVNAGYYVVSVLPEVTTISISSTDELRLAEIGAYTDYNGTNAVNLSLSSGNGTNLSRAIDGQYDGYAVIPAENQVVFRMQTKALRSIRIALAHPAQNVTITAHSEINGDVVVFQGDISHSVQDQVQGWAVAPTGELIVLSSIPMTCPAGQYSTASYAYLPTGTSCSNVTAGYYTSGGGTSATPTAAGNGCLSGQTCGKCPTGWPHSVAGSDEITDCYSDTKSRAWSGTQVACTNPDTTGCSAVTCAACSNSACTYVAYVNASGNADGTIKSGCTTNNASCQQTVASLIPNTGYHTTSGNLESCPANTYTVSYTLNDGITLPSGYKRLEYLESRGQQYINTGFVPTEDYEHKIVFEVVNSTNSNKYICGSGTSGGRGGNLRVNANTLNGLYIGGGSAVNLINTQTLSSGKQVMLMNLHNNATNRVILNGNAIGNSNQDTIRSEGQLTLFASAGSSIPIDVRIYNSVITQNGVVKHNFVPARRESDGAIGMYDLADTNTNTAFHNNAGSGTFAYAEFTSSSTETYNTEFTVPAPTHPHGTFAGWDISGMDTTTHYHGTTSANTSFSTTTLNDTMSTKFKNLRATSGNVNFTANWTCDTGYSGANCAPAIYTINVNLNGGHQNGNSTTQYTFKEKYGVEWQSSSGNAIDTLPWAVRDNYTFAGYYDAATGGNLLWESNGSLPTDPTLFTADNTTVYAHWTPNTYTITVSAGNGVSTVSGTGWTNTGTASMSKTYDYGATIDLDTVITPTNKTGYYGNTYSSSGSGSLSNGSFTVGAGNATITVNAEGITAPTAENVTLASNITTGTFGYSTPTLTGTVENASTDYDSGISLYYKLGYVNVSSATATCPSSGYDYTDTTAGTDNAITLAADEFLAYRCYKMQVYATDGVLTSTTTDSSNAVNLSLIQRRLKFNGNNGTVNNSTYKYGYARYGTGSLKAGYVSATDLNPYTAVREGYTFDGWWTATTGGSQVYDADLNLTSATISGYTSGGNLVLTANKNLYAHWILDTCDPGYYMSSGTCTACGAGYYCTGGTTRTACPAGLTTANDTEPKRHDEAGDCGRPFHLGTDDTLWLRSDKKVATTNANQNLASVALNFDFFASNGTPVNDGGQPDGVPDLFLNLSRYPSPMSSTKNFKMNINGTVYYGCDDGTCATE